MSLVGERVTRIEVLAKGISTNLASISVNASKRVMHLAVHVRHATLVLRIFGKWKAWKAH